MPSQTPVPPTPPATPVTVAIADRALASEVGRHVESVLGWQVVEDTPGLPAQLRLVDLTGAAPGALVVLGSADVDAVRTAMAAGADDVLVWPDDAPRLASLAPRQQVRIAGRLLPVGGSGSGVGTTTAALLVAAALGWTGCTTWLVTGRDGWRMAGADDPGSRADGTIHRTTAAPALRLVRSLRDLHGRTAEDHHVVVDVGTDPRRTLLVGRPDLHLVDALAGSHRRPGRLLTVGDGGLRSAEVRRLAGDLPHLHLAADHRIARAGLRGWLPGRFPGRVVADVTAWMTGADA